ncbi:MAG TPA: hypothetical protein VF707_03970, partial [Ardenticatenaceae bacterium]
NIENSYCAKMEFVLEWTVAKRRSLQHHKECEMREFFLSIVLGVVLGALLGGVAIGILGLLLAGVEGGINGFFLGATLGSVAGVSSANMLSTAAIGEWGSKVAEKHLGYGKWLGRR